MDDSYMDESYVDDSFVNDTYVDDSYVEETNIDNSYVDDNIVVETERPRGLHVDSAIDGNNPTSSIDEIWISQEEYDEIMDHELCIEQENIEKAALEGRRVVDILHLIEKCLWLGKNHASICTSGKFNIIKEKRNGFQTEICLKCDMCNRDYNITSEPNTTSSTPPQINKLAVWAPLQQVAHFHIYKSFVRYWIFHAYLRETFIPFKIILPIYGKIKR